MISKLTLNQELTVEGKKYTVIGIDKYSLKNTFGQTKEWDSYTLKDNTENKTWISFGAVKDYFVQWDLLSEEDFKKQAISPINLDLTGIANVTFQGNPGFSTPVAEILWFNVKNMEYDYVAFERFLKQNGSNME